MLNCQTMDAPLYPLSFGDWRFFSRLQASFVLHYKGVFLFLKLLAPPKIRLNSRLVTSQSAK